MVVISCTMDDEWSRKTMRNKHQGRWVYFTRNYYHFSKRDVQIPVGEKFTLVYPEALRLLTWMLHSFKDMEGFTVKVDQLFDTEITLAEGGVLNNVLCGRY